MITRDVVEGKAQGIDKPDAIVVMADASNLERSLFVINQLSDCNLPLIIALNMVDIAERRGIHIEAQQLSDELGCAVIPMIARTGKGVVAIKQHLATLFDTEVVEEKKPLNKIASCAGCKGCAFQTRYAWSDEVVSRCVKAPRVAKWSNTEKIDKFLTHPILGLVAFMSVMMAVFYLIFSVATIPMDMIDGIFSTLGFWVMQTVPDGDLQSLLVNGVVGGVGGILIFLPQICILFLFLALLEDSGYLARAAFVMDRLMRRIGLPGTAFVPLLAAHACAIPAIMSTRVIQDARDRLITILVAPLVSCSARIPVYVMITALLFPHSPAKAALVFTGAYALGIFAALFMAFIFKKTILPGESKPLVLELPGYRLPNVRTALLYTYDRAKVFVQQAGSIILIISIVLWALATYPKSEQSPEAFDLIQQAELLQMNGSEEAAEVLISESEHVQNRYALSQSFAGKLGKAIEPAIKPLGFDWQIGIGIISSFAAREVIVSTLAIVYGIGDDAVDENPKGLYETMRKAKHDDGSFVFTTATCISLLIFYVLAMQCLPTQAATKRETNSWRWPIFQLVYMTVLAYVASFGAYRLALWLL